MVLSTLNCPINGSGISLMNSSTNSNLSATTVIVSRARLKKKLLCFVTILKSGVLTVFSMSCILSSPSPVSLNKCWSAKTVAIWCKYHRRDWESRWLIQVWSLGKLLVNMVLVLCTRLLATFQSLVLFVWTVWWVIICSLSRWWIMLHWAGR